MTRSRPDDCRFGPGTIAVTGAAGAGAKGRAVMVWRGENEETGRDRQQQQKSCQARASGWLGARPLLLGGGNYYSYWLKVPPYSKVLVDGRGKGARRPISGILMTTNKDRRSCNGAAAAGAGARQPWQFINPIFSRRASPVPPTILSLYGVRSTRTRKPNTVQQSEPSPCPREAVVSLLDYCRCCFVRRATWRLPMRHSHLCS